MICIRRKQEAGFTVIELMVVIGIIGLLAGLLLPVLNRVKDKRAQSVCINNIHQLITATHLHATDNNDNLPWSNWLAGDQPGRPGWLYEINTNAVGPARFKPETGLFWSAMGQHAQMYKCPLDKPQHAEFRHRGQQISSYVMNGAVNKYMQAEYEAYRLGEFNAEDILFWETDENEPRFFNDGASRPDEGVSPRHNRGAIIGSFGNTVEFIKFEDWYREVAQTNRNRMWCAPSLPAGRGDLPPIIY